MVLLPERELKTFISLTNGVATRKQAISPTDWAIFKEKLIALDPIKQPAYESELERDASVVIRAQECRRACLAARKKSLAGEDVITLQIAIQDVERYRDGFDAGLRGAHGRNVSRKFLAILEEEIRYSNDLMLYVRDALQDRGFGVPGVSDAELLAQKILKPIATKAEAAMFLRQKFDELKGRSSSERHADLDRAFRQAIEELDHQ